MLINLTRPAKGLSLIESLITLLVLSIGLLGVAGLQARSLKDAKVATTRAQVVFLVQDITERMRTNVAGAASYNESNSTGSNNGCADRAAATQKTCSPAEQARDDIYHWHRQIQQSLGTNLQPQHKISVNTDNSPNTVTVELSWLKAHSQDELSAHLVEFRL